MELIQDKQKTAYKTLKDECGWSNVMQTPRIEKVVVSVGTGKMIKDKHRIEVVTSRLAKITGQKAASRGAKKSIATFKTREGDTIGYQVTIRGARANDCVNRLIHIALRRTKDFKGISANSIDAMGNYTLGIKEHAIFPEAADEDIKDMFGLAVTIVTSAKNKKDAKAYLTHLGFPFKK